MSSLETKRIQIVVNGQVREVPADQTLVVLLGWLGIDPTRVAVELDRTIVSRNRWPETTVQPEATLEIVQFVGGG